MDQGLSGKRVLVTGGTKGIGRATVLAFARAGSSVVAAHRTQSEDSASVARELKEIGGQHRLVQADVTSSADVAQLAEACKEELGGLAPSAADAGAAADVVVLSLADEQAVEQVLFGDVIGRLAAGTTVVDTSTVSPSFAQDAAVRLAGAGFRRVEACVIGNPAMAKTGQLRVFAAGEESDVDSVRDVLGALSQEIRYLGPSGRAGTLKIAFNLLLGIQTAGLADAVAFAEAAGLSREMFLGALDNSGWSSPILSFRAEFMRRRAYTPAGFRKVLMQKDMRLAQQEAAAHGVTLPLVDSSADRFADVIAAGRGDEDAAVVADVAPTAAEEGTAA